MLKFQAEVAFKELSFCIRYNKFLFNKKNNNTIIKVKFIHISMVHTYCTTLMHLKRTQLVEAFFRCLSDVARSVEPFRLEFTGKIPCDKITNYRGNQIIRWHRWNCGSRVLPNKILS